MPGGARGPDFIVIGAQRAGTSWLYKRLSGLDRVWAPPIKEVHFFDRLERHVTGVGMQRYRRHLAERFLGGAACFLPQPLRRRIGSKVAVQPWGMWDLKYFRPAFNWQWYLDLLESHEGAVSGDFTPAYCMCSKSLIASIAKRLPDTRFIFILREPIGRAWSQYMKENKHAQSSADQLGSSFERFVSGRHRVLERSDYATMLANWRDCVEPERLKVMFYDDLEAAPKAFFSEILSFVGLSDEALLAEQTALDTKPINSFSPGGGAPLTAQALLIPHVQPMVERLLGLESSDHVRRWLDGYRELHRTVEAFKPER